MSPEGLGQEELQAFGERWVCVQGGWLDSGLKFRSILGGQSNIDGDNCTDVK